MSIQSVTLSLMLPQSMGLHLELNEADKDGDVRHMVPEYTSKFHMKHGITEFKSKHRDIDPEMT